MLFLGRFVGKVGVFSREETFRLVGKQCTKKRANFVVHRFLSLKLCYYLTFIYELGVLNTRDFLDFPRISSFN
jgi:hypothetical protein